MSALLFLITLAMLALPPTVITVAIGICGGLGLLWKARRELR